MKPRLKLHMDGSVSLASSPETYRFHCAKPRTSRHFVVSNIRQACGSVGAFNREFEVPHTLMQVALDDGHNKEFAMGGASGALRAMFGLPVCSSANTKPLNTTIRVALRAVTIAVGRKAT
jgi:hypothetical protein